MINCAATLRILTNIGSNGDAPWTVDVPDWL